ncbi:MAG TPA: aldehyde dehydrogenase family protein, partial [Acidimicrobiia bacterium]
MSWKHWIDGAWADSKDGGDLKVENPATGEVVDTVIDGTAADIDMAVQAAKTAFYDGRWSKLSPAARSLALWRLADLVEQ